MKKSFFTPLILTLLFVVSCKDAQPQTREEKKEAEKVQNRENLEQFFLGAIKLCEQAPNERCCKDFIKIPYINAMEQYIYVFEEDRIIFDNRDNPFKLKEIRDDMADKVTKIKKKAIAVDSDNLVYQSYGFWSIGEYDFNQEKLKINGTDAIYFKGSFGHTPDRFKFQELMNFKSSLSMSAKEAEKIFDFYEEIKEKQKLGSTKPLNTRITYSLQKPLPKSRHPERFAVKLKKVELFLYRGWSDKIGEFTF